jgi:excisionase family DNA binding protein
MFPPERHRVAGVAPAPVRAEHPITDGGAESLLPAAGDVRRLTNVNSLRTFDVVGPAQLQAASGPFPPAQRPEVASGQHRREGRRQTNPKLERRRPEPRATKPPDSGLQNWSGKPDSNRRPSDRRGAQAFAAVRKGSFPLEWRREAVQLSQGDQLVVGDFAPLLPDGVTNGALPERMLTVRGAARQLGVSTATVYKLCARGDLAHVRVLNALRIPTAALAAFLSAGPSRKG